MKNLVIFVILFLSTLSVNGQCSPGTIAGHVKVCIGDNTTLVDTVSGGTWSTSNAAIATINAATGLVTGISAGAVTLTYALSGACSTHYATRAFTVANIPTLGAIHDSLNACAGSGGNLNVLYSNVTWSSRNPSIASITPVDSISCYVNGISAGSTYIVYTSDFCTLVSDSVDFTVKPSPSVGHILYGSAPSGGYEVDYGSTGIPIDGFGMYCAGDTTTFSIEGTSGGRWSLTDGPAFGTTIDSITGFLRVRAGTTDDAFQVNYTVTNSYGCTTITDTVAEYVYPTLIPYRDTILGPITVALGDTVRYISSYVSDHIGRVLSENWYISSYGSGDSMSPAGVFIARTPGFVMIDHWMATGCVTSDTTFQITVTLPASAPATSHFASYIVNSCSGPQLYVNVNPHTSTNYMTTEYGDGYMDTLFFSPDTAALLTSYTHSYAYSGAYTINQVFYVGGSRADSITSSYTQISCSDVSLSFYIDANGNCRYDTSVEHLNYTPMWVVVDSNGVSVDTISATSGIYYPASGIAGDVYSFRVFRSDTALLFSCASSGVIYDTLGSAAYTSLTQNIALSCPSSTGFDLFEHSYFVAGRHSAFGSIVAGNNKCTGEDGVVTLQISPQYIFDTSAITPRPTSISGSTATWNITDVSATSAPVVINYHLSIPASSAWLTPGDTVHTSVTITPTTGDIDTTNNFTYRVDTILSSYDPNSMAVLPEGNILNGTKLHYSIAFENDGNDTARNIYVMDTLSDNLDPATLQLEGASAAMDISVLNYGSHKIVKFDFPAINLPDSSHHGQCTGIIMYSIKPNSGLANGTFIYGSSGVFFDDNPVVVTNTTKNIIVVPQLSIASTHSDSVCSGETVHFTATPVSVNTPHFQWYINATPSGSDSTGFTAAVAGGDTIRCRMTTIMDDTVFSTSNNIVLISRGAAPVSGTISGGTSVCAGALDTLTASVTGGTWSSSSSLATVSLTGIVTGITAGVDTLIYTVTNACGAASSHSGITVIAMPVAGTISGSTSVCVGSHDTLSSTSSGGMWTSSSSSLATISAGVITGLSAGIDTFSYTVTNTCGAVSTHSVITILPLPVAATISGSTSVCVGSADTLTASGTGSWRSSSTTLATVSGGIVHGLLAGTDTIAFTVTNSCGVAVTSTVVTVNPLPVAGSLSGSAIVCIGTPDTLTATSAGGTWSSIGSSATVSGGIITGSSAGVDTIAYTVTNGCGSATVHSVVTVYPLPVAGTISGSTGICAGARDTLTVTTSGGTWVSGSSSLATVSGGIVRGVAAGIDTISYITTNACGSAAAHIAITIRPLPVAGIILGSTVVCTGDSVALTSTATGGTWSSSSSPATVSASGFVVGVTAGSDTIAYTVTNSCGSASTYSLLTINPSPVAGVLSGATSVCTGSTITITPTITGGIWSSSTTSLATVSGGVVGGEVTGIDTIIYTITNSCGSARAIYPITINTLPNAGTISGVDSICPGDTIFLADAITGGSWSSSNTAMVTISPTTGAAIGLSPGTITISYTETNSCGNESAVHTLSVRPLSECPTSVKTLINPNIEGISIFPNPNSGSFVVQVPTHENDLNITIMDVQGKTVRSMTITNKNLLQIPVDMSRAAAGTYLVKADMDGQTYRMKIVVF